MHRRGRRRSLSDDMATARKAKKNAPVDVSTCACGPLGGACVLAAVNGTRNPCVAVQTEASASLWGGLHCMRSREHRGLFVIARAADGRTVCTGGDSFHITVANERGRFASLSEPTGSAPSVYWVDLSASALLSDAQSYEVSIALTETQRRERWPGAVDDAPRDLAEWLRRSVCVWRHVTRGSAIDVPAPDAARAPAHREPLCRALPRDGAAMGYVRPQREPSTCDGGALCDGNALAALLNTSNEQRYQQRARKGFGHVLKPLGCRLKLFEEADVVACLRGRQLLNVGSDVAVDVQRGFARLNASLRGWTRRRPGSAA